MAERQVVAGTGFACQAGWTKWAIPTMDKVRMTICR